MSSVKCVGLMAAAGAVVTGGLSLYKGAKARKQVITNAQMIADKNNGRIPTGGMKNGVLWDGFTTVEQVKKDSKKALVLGTATSSVIGGITTAIISGLTLLAKAKLK